MPLWTHAAKPTPDVLFEESRELALLAAWAQYQGDDVRAAMFLRRAVVVDPRSPYLWQHYAQACERVGNKDEAARAHARWQSLITEVSAP